MPGLYGQQTSMHLWGGAGHNWRQPDTVAWAKPGAARSHARHLLAQGPPTNPQTPRDACVQVWDVRSLQRAAEIPQVHAMPVRDVDFARQEPHKIATAGDDGKLRFWDLRW